MKFLLKILLLIFKFLLKVAKIFAFKKLESFIDGFLKRNDIKETEIKPTFKLKGGGVGVSKKPTVKKLTIKRDEPKEEESEEPTEREISVSRYDTDTTTDKGMGSAATTALVATGVVAASVGIASIVRDKNEKPKEGDLGDAEFSQDDTYDEIFMKGFKKSTGMDYTFEGEGKSGGSFSDFLSGFTSGVKKGEKGAQKSTQREWVERPKKYQQYTTARRMGQNMDFMDRYSYDRRSQAIGSRKINEIIIHCTATPEGREVSLEELYNWHKARNFIDIGYHFVVHIDGTIESARPLHMIGAHCEGHNAHSIGISYVGGTRSDDPQKPKDTRTEAQRAQIWNLVYYLLRYFPSATIHGHNEYAAKACPCFNVRQEWNDLQYGKKRGGFAQVGSSSSRSISTMQFNDDKLVQKGERKVMSANEPT